VTCFRFEVSTLVWLTVALQETHVAVVGIDFLSLCGRGKKALFNLDLGGLARGAAVGRGSVWLNLWHFGLLTCHGHALQALGDAS
jgi:hypothetical protein